MRSNMPLSSALVSLLLGVATTVTATTPNFLGYSSHILPRADEAPVPQEVCSDLTISSNNGDRKVAIVIDSSGSMADSDPQDFRLVAARALNEFLISNSEAGGGKPDQVVVIGFDYSSYLVFGPGDPGDPEADKEIGLIQAGGGTYIAGGVLQAIDEIGKMSGDTNGRSAIVVFTDGSVSCQPGFILGIGIVADEELMSGLGYHHFGRCYQERDQPRNPGFVWVPRSLGQLPARRCPARCARVQGRLCHDYVCRGNSEFRQLRSPQWSHIPR